MVRNIICSLNKLKYILAICVFSSITMGAIAQRGQLEYALGLRAGSGIGVTMQYFKTDEHVFEGFIMNQNKAYNITGLYQFHQQIYDVKGMKWYVGFGGHVNMFPDTRQIPDQYATAGRSNFVPGLDGMVGLAYYFRYMPLQLTVDWKPEYNFVMGRKWYFFNSAISIRYRL